MSRQMASSRVKVVWTPNGRSAALAARHIVMERIDSPSTPPCDVGKFVDRARGTQINKKVRSHENNLLWINSKHEQQTPTHVGLTIMSGLKDKILGKTGGSVKALTNGSKLPTTGPLKENDPHTGTVSHRVESFANNSLLTTEPIGGPCLPCRQEHHSGSARCFHTTMLLASPGLRLLRGPVRGQGREGHLHRGDQRRVRHPGLEREARSCQRPPHCALLG